MKRSYKQDCALAHALDLVGERWTLLVVRELLTGPRRYGELAENLPGMGTNLLATRLKEMLAAELLTKEANSYQLTQKGRGLEPVVHALVRFGLAMNVESNSDYLHKSEWDAVALKALYDPERDTGLDGDYAIELDGNTFCVSKTRTGLTVTESACEDAIATVSLAKSVGRLLAAGELSFSSAISKRSLSVAGNRKEARKLLAAFGMA